jgi:hypothetical protein
VSYPELSFCKDMRTDQLPHPCNRRAGDGRATDSERELKPLKISLKICPTTPRNTRIYKRFTWRRGSESNINCRPFATITTPSSISFCARSSMFSTFSQGFPDFKNYFGVGEELFPTQPQLLRNYYFTGAFTGGDMKSIKQILRFG